MLVLVVTLLGVLFVTGITLLATLNFEADIIAAERLRDRSSLGVQAVVDELDAVLRDALAADHKGPFGPRFDSASHLAFAELPAHHSLISPIEPYHNDENANELVDEHEIVWPWITDLEWITTGKHEETYSVLETDASWPSGVPDDFDAPTPVDADGDGITDTRQINVERLGFSQAQIETLARQLNDPANPTGGVFLGLRVVAHGGLVNLNESHPVIIKNVFDLPDWFDCTVEPDANDLDREYFLHRPCLQSVPYSPLQEEVTLRRRVLLPPRMIAPSLLHGNRLDSQISGLADMPTKLFPPIVGEPSDTIFEPVYHSSRRDFETVYESGHRYLPFTFDELYNPRDLDSPPMWVVRMEPFTSFTFDPDRDTYDRRHLVTTISYDDLLSRGGRWRDFAGQDWDLIEKMREANRTADPEAVCRASGAPAQPFPFEYANYPHNIPDRTVPSLDLDAVCDCPTRGSEVCRFDPRKGRLLLSLPWLDDATDYGFDQAALQRQTPDIPRLRNRLIHDVFMMLARNARGPYWDFACMQHTDCATGAGEVCARRCVGGDEEGRLCIDDDDCPDGNCPVHLEGVCVDQTSGKRTRREERIARTAASLTANLLDFMDDNTTCLRGPRNGLPCAVDGDCCVGSDCGVCQPVRECIRGRQRGGRCVVDEDCSGGATCHPIRNCVGGSFDGLPCIGDSDCSPGGVCMDQDQGIPTRVALRSFDFSDTACVGGTRHGLACVEDSECGVGGTCLPATAGWEFGSERLTHRPAQYVYGLERQPFITEIAAYVDVAGPKFEYAVELFNPYSDDIYTNTGRDTGYYLRIEPSGLEIKLKTPIPGRGSLGSDYLVVTNAAATKMDKLLGAITSALLIEDTSSTGGNVLAFASLDTIYLIRKVFYRETGNVESIVVDQFEVDGDNIAKDLTGVHSIERAGVKADTAPWFAPIPADPADESGSPSLGFDNVTPTNAHPVEVNFANTGRLRTAFPTTGSMLLLMRHANRSLMDYSLETKDHLAFTTWLTRTTKTEVANLEIREVTQIDNGRMPVFDQGLSRTECIGGFNDGRSCTRDSDCPGGLCREVSRYAHHVHPGRTPPETPGGLENLPWGQLVFDYFTALPLRNGGPYYNPTGDLDFAPAADAQPRVDLDGLRVHGRININAAPWKVLAGLPLMPADRFPTAFREKIATFALSKCVGGEDQGQWCASSAACRGGSCQVQDAGGPMADDFAQAIVAYRELREVLPPGPNTGDFGADDQTGRGWNGGTAFRRGTGFLTVGELANVRHSLAGHPAYRIDGAGTDYVEAVARLLALGDWVTVRSQVFTTYGVLRGDDDESIADPLIRASDVDRRAVRFQETMDRLPTFLGEPSPVCIGQRTMGKYMDVRND